MVIILAMIFDHVYFCAVDGVNLLHLKMVNKSHVQKKAVAKVQFMIMP